MSQIAPASVTRVRDPRGSGATAVRGWLVEESEGIYRPTDDKSEATHYWALTAAGGDTIDAVEIGEEQHGLRSAVQDDVMTIYGG